nr:uncharacterized protein LOC113820822 [Penaeus vannamei]
MEQCSRRHMRTPNNRARPTRRPPRAAQPRATRCDVTSPRITGRTCTRALTPASAAPCCTHSSGHGRAPTPAGSPARAQRVAAGSGADPLAGALEPAQAPAAPTALRPAARAHAASCTQRLHRHAEQ